MADRPLDSSHDLLLGLVALQVGLIDQSQLGSAFERWSRDKGLPLADHLADIGAFGADARAAVEAMVALHLQLHNGDTEKSLAAIDAGSSTRERLASLGDPDLTHTLTHVASSTTEAGGDTTFAYSVTSVSSGDQRFRVLRPHARGGLGAVFVALDGELCREVALKRLLEHHADDPISRQRFLLEAEITGGLEHPGIVPVYGLGTYADGRPYYAMRFIRGNSLKEAIARFHADETLEANPGQWSLELRKLLRRFLDVCNAIDYAHSRGVLHRDIKPGNIIVGKHGETLVVDWGLAKAQGRGASLDPTEERPLAPSSASSSAETLPGQALGTPAYMSPEQARGDLSSLGPASDVYALGATLYGLLTGRQPFEGSVADVLRRVQAGAIRPPRQLDPVIDRPLEAICLKAMALAPADRYPTARGLADDVESWMADEPVSAWSEPWVVRLRRSLRRNRTLVTGLAVATLTTVVGLGTIALLEGRSNRRLAQKNAALELATERAEEARERAQRSDANARQAVDDFLTHVSESKLINAPGLQPLRKELLAAALRHYQAFLAERGDEPDLQLEVALAHARIGLVRLSTEGDQAALPSYQQARELLAGMLAANPDSTELIDRLARTEMDIALIRTAQGELETAEQGLRRSCEAFERLERENRMARSTRTGYANSLYNLANLLVRQGTKPEEPRRLYQRNVALLEQLDREDPEDLRPRAQMLPNLSALCYTQTVLGQFDDALDSARRAVVIGRGLAGEEPAVPDHLQALGDALERQAEVLRILGRPEEALPPIREARDIYQRLVDENPRVLAHAASLGASCIVSSELELQLGRIEAAGVSAHEAQAIHERLDRADPGSVQYKEPLAKSLNMLGRIELALRNPKAGLGHFHRAVDAIESVPERTPLEQYNLACNLALCSAVAEPSASGRDSGEGFADRAVEAFRRATERGVRMLDHFRRDPDLDPLRDRPDFQLILLDLAMPDDPFSAR